MKKVGFVVALLVGIAVVFQNCGQLDGIETANQVSEGLVNSASLGEFKKPNVIFIMLDDAGYHDFKNPDIIKPNIDKLKSQGMTYTHFYTNPTCSPTRASIMTGYNPGFMGIEHALCVPDQTDLYEKQGLQSGSRRGIPKQVKSLPKVLNGLGYQTAHVGKWHLGEFSYKKAHKQGYTYTATYHYHNHRFTDPTFNFYLNGKVDKTMGVDKNKDGEHFYGNCSKSNSINCHKTEVIGNLSKAYINRMKASKKPFFLNVWFNAPHTPHAPDKSWKDTYRDDPKYSHLTENQIKYYGAISQADANIGKIIDLIDRDSDLRNNTIIMVTSDNGGSPKNGMIPVNGKNTYIRNYSNYPFLGQKGSVFEGGIRLPLIVRWPAQLPGNKKNRSVLRSSDLLATLAQLGGSSSSYPGEGESFASLLVSGTTAVKSRSEPLFIRQRGQLKFERGEDIDDYEESEKYISHERWVETYREGNLKYVATHDSEGRKDYLFDFSKTNKESENERDSVNVINSHPQANNMKNKMLDRGMSVSQIPVVEGSRSGSLTKVGNVYRMTGGQVRLKPHDLFEAHDGSFTFSMQIRPYPGAMGRASVIARKNTSWTISMIPNGKIQLHVRNQINGQELTTLTSDDVLEPGRNYNVTFTMAGFTGNEGEKTKEGEEPERTYTHNTIRLYVTPASDKGLPEPDAIDGTSIFNMNPSGYDTPVILGNNDQDGVNNKPFRGQIEVLTANSYELRPEHLQRLYNK